ncbi:hypothetical protein PAXRUDRAFT_163920 [Paxillus rubicundulus Ve08.2h10]|uniref:Uncharacterized protein n=1 Tax=Paxillus rubicundulus Ve08.2h10 TaxID=930991 RepID=A0A0D0DJY7_9AGAM|nr:hypothetical protein PAXRUDRAFT_163920 [Paxillus rubicundulus Ve08.2h10]
MSSVTLPHPVLTCGFQSLGLRATASELAAQGNSYNIQYHFSLKTSNTLLRHHVEVQHALLYLEQAEKYGWVIMIKFAKSAFASGYTFKTLRHVLTQPGVKLDALPPPPDHSDHLPLGVIQPQKSRPGASLPPLTIDGLKDHIVHYLVANDLVRILPLHRLFSQVTRTFSGNQHD